MESNREEQYSNRELKIQIKLAERIVEIQSIYGGIPSLCEKYILSSYVKPDITVIMDYQSIKHEAYEAQLENLKANVTQVYSPAYLETVAVYRKIATRFTEYNTFLLHGSVIATDGLGYMITAPSGVGKTTRTKLWVDRIPNSFVVNGDKPLIRVAEDAVYAYGTPWCGKEGWNTNTGVPLRGIFLLERAEDGEADVIEEIGFAEAFPALLKQTFRPADREAWRKTLGLVRGMAGKVKVFRMKCGPTEEAVRMAWEKGKCCFFLRCAASSYF